VDEVQARQSLARLLLHLNSAKLAATIGISESSSGTQTPIQVYTMSGGVALANPINLRSASDQVYPKL
jgi:hypothetical protein